MTPELLSVAEAAALLGVPKHRAYTMVKLGEIPSVKLGERTVRVPAEALAAWLRAKVTGPVGLPPVPQLGVEPAVVSVEAAPRTDPADLARRRAEFVWQSGVKPAGAIQLPAGMRPGQTYLG